MRRIYTQPQRERRLPVTVLGATGLVGQRVIALLDGHPWLELAHGVASERRVGARYGEVVRWHVETPPPVDALDMRLEAPDLAGDLRGQIVISALPANEARELEPRYAQAGAVVFSNASAYRMDEDVPLIVPEINPDHLAALGAQRERRGWLGAIVTNPNCSTIGLTLALAPLQRFGPKRVIVTTFQAASGAGYPGVASLDLIDNVVPYIGGEEEKLETETRKILGGWAGERFVPLDARVSATCARVPVRDGHLESVSVEFERKPEPEEIIAAWRDFTAEPQRLGLPSAPQPAIVYREEHNRPQPIADRLTGDGMAVTVGRLRPCDVLDYKFFALSHNTIRGAAGAALLNVELAVAQGLVG
ncbi:MAG TPA: aspartate-semialdehyde dehydrogenase [Ktedonobacterales bacterium]|jgi:aspartate-semialdehyde dehydrogenase|nr:aspartate-semialdehyde dehydrogenase [Ktedonobacterales bacterium]